MRPVILSLLALSLAAQGSPAAKKPVHHAKKAAASAAPTAKDPVLAKVGPAVVTESDFQAVLAQMPQQQMMMVQIVQGAKEQLVTQIAERKLLALEAEKMGLSKTPEFARSLAQIKDDLLARTYLVKENDNLKAQMKLSDADLQAYYAAHLQDFKTPEKDTARHILVLVNGPATNGKGVTDEEAKKKIATIQADLKAGKKLEDLTATYSDDPGSKDKGGLYEDFDPNTMDPAFAKAVETQAIGTVGEPVKSMYGYHLIQVLKRVPASQQTFEEAKAKVTEEATKARQEEVWKNLMTKLKKEFPVTLTMPKAPAPKAEPAPAGAPESAPVKPETAPAATTPAATPAPSAKPDAAPTTKPEASK